MSFICLQMMRGLNIVIRNALGSSKTGSANNQIKVIGYKIRRVNQASFLEANGNEPNQIFSENIHTYTLSLKKNAKIVMP